MTEVTNGSESNCGTLLFDAKRDVWQCRQPLRDRTILVVGCVAIVAVGAFGFWRAKPPPWAVAVGITAGGMAVIAALVVAVPQDCGSVLGSYEGYSSDSLCGQIDDRRALAVALLGAAIALAVVPVVIAASRSGRQSTAAAHR